MALGVLNFVHANGANRSEDSMLQPEGDQPVLARRRKRFKSMSITGWVLGGEIIRNLQETPKPRKKPVNELIDTLLENDGPLISHCDSEEQQRLFVSTCRKLHRYLSASVSHA